jgi:hypothetical protein
MPFNQTNVELKHPKSCPWGIFCTTFNQTNVELKQ